MNNVNDDVGKINPPPYNDRALNGVPPQEIEKEVSPPPPDVGFEKIPKIPPAASQGWYIKCIPDSGTTLSNAKIYSIVAHNPLQKPDEIQKPKPNPHSAYNPAPMTNPMPQRTPMYTYQRPYAPSSMRYS